MSTGAIKTCKKYAIMITGCNLVVYLISKDYGQTRVEVH
jgi:hypothetical protein